ncbi:MAG: glucose-6-phosphate isomerase [Leucothrix sp.]
MTKPSNLQCFTDLSSYHQLKQHFNCCSKLHMRRLFSVDRNRYQRMSLEFDWLLLDYSKNRVTDKTLQLLFSLAREANLERSISNTSEAITQRIPNDPSTIFACEQGQRIRQLTEQLHSGTWLGHSHKPITDIVNIGIAHSRLGSQSVCEALRPYHQCKQVGMHFIADCDGLHLQDVLENLNPETTVFIVSSQGFDQSNPSTLTQAETAKRWLLNANPNSSALMTHFLAVTANTAAAKRFGIQSSNIFQLKTIANQRQTAWISIGLPILLSIGAKHFQAFLAGVSAMDAHFQTERFEQNMPVIMALIGIWYNNFFKTESHAILPYDYNLRNLPRCIEQIDMQNNGKSIDRLGNLVNFATSPIIWSSNGSTDQHAFYQMLHRGQKIVPADFIVSMRTHSVYQKQHHLMFANAIAQTEALMQGRTRNETLNDLTLSDASNDENIISQRTYDGNNPSNMLLLQRLTPKSLGILLTLYEHKTFAQGAIWNLSDYEQTGLELSKTFSSHVLQDIFMPANTQRHDASTNALINHYRKAIYPRSSAT